jgi:hypothetical protein
MAAFAGPVIASMLPFLFQKMFPGKDGRVQQTSTMTPEQMKYLQNFMGQLQGPTQQSFDYLSKIFSDDPETMKSFEAPAMRQFNEQIIPQLTEKYAGIGSGSMGSSAMGQEMGAQGAALQERLQEMRSNLKEKAFGHLTNMMGIGMGAKSFENNYQQGEQGLGQAMAPAMGQYIGQKLPGAMTQAFQGFLDLFKPKATPLAQGPAGLYPTEGNYNPYSNKMY